MFLNGDDVQSRATRLWLVRLCFCTHLGTFEAGSGGGAAWPDRRDSVANVTPCASPARSFRHSTNSKSLVWNALASSHAITGPDASQARDAVVAVCERRFGASGYSENKPAHHGAHAAAIAPEQAPALFPGPVAGAICE